MTRQPRRSAEADIDQDGGTPSLEHRQLLSVTEVGEIFGRAPRTIRSWIARGLLRPVRVGGSVFVPLTQIEALLVPAETKGAPSGVGQTKPKPLRREQEKRPKSAFQTKL